MDNQTCSQCRFWAQVGGPPATQRGAVVLAAAAQGQQEPVPGHCRVRLAVGLMVVTVVLPNGARQQEPQFMAGYGTVPDTFPACGEFRPRDLKPGEVMANDVSGQWVQP